MAAAMIGAGGLSLIKTSEGLRYNAYADPVGIPTICYGHTGPDVKLGQLATLAQCEEMLNRDIAAHQVSLIGPRNCIGFAPLNQNQLDAVTSLTFNIGNAKFCSSTMARKLTARDYRGAALEFPKWSNATVNGKLVKLPGLIKRRSAEKALFENPSIPRTGNAPTDALRAISSASY